MLTFKTSLSPYDNDKLSKKTEKTLEELAK